LLQLKFDIKRFVFLSLAFILSAVVGTVSHEYGHYAVAKYLGYSSTVSYGYTNWNDKATKQFMDSAYLNYSKEIESQLDFPGKNKFYLIQQKQIKDGFWITLGGPFQTILTGTLGLIFVFFQRKKIRNANALSISQWIIVFLSLFWLRQLANLVTWVAGYFFKGQFSLSADEIGLAISLGLPTGTISIITALIALGVLVFIIFKILPAKIRLTFILAGIFGGVFGYFFWLLWIGPILLP
jgi:hypothetical protein